MKHFFLNFVGIIPTTAQQPNSPTAQQPNSYNIFKPTKVIIMALLFILSNMAVRGQEPLNDCLDNINWVPLGLAGPCSPLVINGDQIWTPNNNYFVWQGWVNPGDPINIKVPIVVEQGAKLEIYGLDIGFAPHCNLVVKQGGRLVLGDSNGTPAYLHGLCQKVWQGVRILGPGSNVARTYDDYNDGDGIWPNYATFTNTGKALIEDAVIGIAAIGEQVCEPVYPYGIDIYTGFHDAVRNDIYPFDDTPVFSLPNYITPNSNNFEGGVIKTSLGLNLNKCFYGIGLYKYDNLPPLGKANDYTSIEATLFTATAPLPKPFGNHQPPVTTTEAGVYFTEYKNLVIGEASNISIYDKNTFTAIKFGIKGHISNNISIKQNLFTNCYSGVYYQSLPLIWLFDNIVIKHNNFDGCRYATELIGSRNAQVACNAVNLNFTGQTVMGSLIRGTHFSIVEHNDYLNTDEGVIAYNNHNFNTTIRKNYFKDNWIGVYGIGNNTPINVRCNAFSDHNIAIGTFLDQNSTGAFSDQGDCISPFFDYPMNYFSHPNQPQLWDLYTDVASISYAYAYDNHYPEITPTINDILWIDPEDGCSGDSYIAFPTLAALTQYFCPGDITCELNSEIAPPESNDSLINQIAHAAWIYQQNADDSELKELEAQPNSLSVRVLLPWYLQTKQYEKATETLSAFKPISSDDTYLVEFYKIAITVYQSGRYLNDLTEEELDTLIKIARYDQSTSFYAQAWYSLATNRHYLLPYPNLPEILQPKQGDGSQQTGKTTGLANTGFTAKMVGNSLTLFYANTAINQTKVQLKLFDLQGRILFNSSLLFTNNAATIPLGNLPAGIYLLQAVLDNQKIYTQQITILK